MAGLFSISLDELVNYDGHMPREVVIEDKSALEQLRLISQLSEKDKGIIMNLIDTMLTKQRFQEFFQKNLAS